MATLNYDAQGFIVGLGRIERQTSNVHDDTQEIIRILKGQRQISDSRMQDMANSLRQINQSTRLSSRIQSRSSSNNTSSGQGTRSPSRTSSALTAPDRMTRRASNTIDDSSNTTGRNQRNSQSRTRTDNISPNNSSGQNRDARGRFTAQADNANFINRLSDKIGDKFKSNLDTENIDPLVQSAKEVKSLLSPVTGLFSLLTGGRNKPSRYERRRDRNTQNSLDDIEDAIRHGDNGSGSGGILGGLAGRMLGGAGGLAGGALGLLKKGGGKFLGVLGALIGAGSLAMNWDNLDHKGKSAGVGGLAGGVGGAATGAMVGTAIFPGVGTVVGGVLGGWLGKEGGEALGKTASPYIKSWTGSLQQYNLGEKIKTLFQFGVNPFFTGLSLMLPKLNDWVTKTTGVDVGKGFSDLWSFLKSKLGFSDDKSDAPDAPQSEGFFGGVWRNAKKLFGFGGGQWNGSGGQVGGGAGGDWGGGANPLGGKKLTDAVIGGGIKGVVVGGGGNFGASRGNRSHTGQDIAVPIGTPIVAPEDGVFTMGSTKHGGKEAYLKTADGRRYGFAHLSEYAGLQPGQTVKAGTTIAKSGNTGIGSGPHLHVSYTDAQGRKIDPKTVMVGGSLSAGGRVSGKLAKGSSSQYDSLIAASAARHGVDPALMKAMIHTESGFDPNARSPVGAMGLGQLMPATARRFGVKNPWNPAENIEGMAKYMAYHKKMFPNDRNKQVAAYNAGEGNVQKYGGIPPFKETQEYVKRVSGRYGLYAQSVSGQLPTSTVAQTGRRSSKMPTIPKVAIPQVPKVAQKLNSDKPQMIIANNQDILPQNVSDRLLAHAITGGLGEDRWLG